MVDVREVNIIVVGDRRMPVLGEMNGRAISTKVVRGSKGGSKWNGIRKGAASLNLMTT